MLIVIFLFGFISALTLFIEAVMILLSGLFWLGIGLLLSVVYIVAITIVLIRADCKSTDNSKRITNLENQLKNLKEQLNIKDEETEPVNENESDDVLKPDVEINLQDGVRLCKTCGFQLFPEDKVCPICNEEVKE